MSGIEITNSRCGCGGRIRIHWNDFQSENSPFPERRFYATCEKNSTCECGNVTEWFKTSEEAVAAALRGPGNSETPEQTSLQSETV